MQPQVVIALINLAGVVIEQLAAAAEGREVDLDKLQASTEGLRGTVDDWKRFKSESLARLETFAAEAAPERE